MKVVNLATYGADLALNRRVRPAHVEYVLRLLNDGRLVVGGPFRDGSGALFVYEVADVDQARSIVADDPYVREGVVTSHALREWDSFAAAPALIADDHTHQPSNR